MFKFRYRVARSLIVVGLFVMPESRYKRELLYLLNFLKQNVEKEVSEQSRSDEGNG